MALDTEGSRDWKPATRGNHVSKLGVPAVKARAADRLDEKIKVHMKKHDVAYDLAFHAVLEDPDNLRLKRAYAGGAY